MIRGAFAIAMAIALAPAVAHGRTVVAFPVTTKAMPDDVARGASKLIVDIVQSLGGIEIVDSATAKKSLDVELSEQAGECADDILCLAQIGEILDAQLLLLASIKRTLSGVDVLRLSVVDVAKATLIDTVKWDVPTRPGALDDAIAAAVRRLLVPPDATLILDVFPGDAKIELYGESLKRRAPGTPVPFWSGVYYGRASRAGYESADVFVDVRKSSTARVRLELESDPLWVDPSRPRAREESTTPVAAAGDEPPPPPTRSPFANWIAWSVVAVGAGASVAGGVIMTGAQSDYNDVAGEIRFTPDMTKPAQDAVAVRNQARDSFSLGSNVMYVGLGVAAVGLGWIVIDAIVTGGGGPKTTVSSRGGALGAAF